MTNFFGKQVAVFGLGRSGAGALKLLHKNGAVLYAWDDNEVARNALSELHFVGGINITPPSEMPWDDINILVLSPGIPHSYPRPHEVAVLAKEHDCEIICDIELLYISRPDALYIGITGTNGKSTTTALIGHLCEKAGIKAVVGGNIGISAAELADSAADIYILELSSYQLELLGKATFDIAVMLNISEDHIDRHGSMGGYVAAKSEIFKHLADDGLAICGIDDQYSRAMYDAMPGDKVAISGKHMLDNGIYIRDNILYDGNDAYLLPESKSLPGAHNWQNIAAAYAVLHELDVKGRDVVNGISSFAGLPHRMEVVAEIDGVIFVNDSKATNAEAASNALAHYDNIYWVAGGRAKEGGISSLEKYFPRIRKAFLIGEAEADFAKTLDGKVAYSKCGTMEIAFEEASAEAYKGGNDCVGGEKKSVVLLSPACSSFDAYRSFEVRGDDFRSLSQNFIKKQ